MCRAKSVTNVLRSRYPQQGGSAQRQIGFGLIFLDGRGAGGQLHAACSARCNLRPLQKNRIYFCIGLGSTRTRNFMCRSAVPADFRGFSLMSGGFQYDYRGKKVKYPKNSACGALLAPVCQVVCG